MPKRATTPATTPAWPFADLKLAVDGQVWRCKLTAHAGSGQWRKRHLGRDYYFGPLDDPDAALDRWRAEWPQIVQGRPRDATPAPAPGSLTVKALGERFLASRLARVERGEIERNTFRDYRLAARWATAQLGPDRSAAGLTPSDFESLLAAQARDHPTVRIERVRRIRIMFRWGYEAGLLDRPVRFGPDFRVPRPSDQRKRRNLLAPRVLTPEQIRAALKLSRDYPPWVRAYLLLGINGGFGITDIMHLPRGAWDGCWLDWPRHKTGAMRRVPLWPETAAALKRAVPDKGKVLLPNGVGAGRSRATASTVLKPLCETAGWGDLRFYDLRRTFATVAVETGDEAASKVIMGHVLPGMLHVYVQRFPDDRLERVARHVRTWLYRRQSAGMPSAPDR